MITRQQYMDSNAGMSEAERVAEHRAYYAQLVTGGTISAVVRSIGHDRLMKSTDKWMNDIPLSMWDNLAKFLPCGSFKALGDHATLAGLVCVAKEAARQYVEGQRDAS